MNKKVCCFGEVLLRLSPSASGMEWMENNMPFYIGGAELNVATALAHWELPVKYMTALPQNYLSDQLIKYLGHCGIDSSSVLFTGNRLGIYYLPAGYDVKNAIAFYDRDHTSFSALRTGMIDWDKVLEECSWFHLTAISPALSQELSAVCLEAVTAARQKGIPVSLDLNYRSKLWQYGKRPAEVMPALVQNCDVVMGNIWAVESLLGVAASLPDSKKKTKEELTAAVVSTDEKLRQAFPLLKYAAYTYRLDETYWAILRSREQMFISREYDTRQAIDRVGSGDCFMAGLIFGLHKSLAPPLILEFATAAAIGKLSEAGDATKQSAKAVFERINKP